jgi:hypothetical protein
MRWIAALLAATVGACLGLAYGWFLNPVAASDTSASSLRIDYRTDYVLMVAEAYQSTRDVAAAQQQLEVLGGEAPAETAAAAALEARSASYAANDLSTLDDLVGAMRSAAPTPPPGNALP